jgi:SAM-dependent methyltransferase
MPQERSVSAIHSDSDAWRIITGHYEGCLRKHGATPAGVDWPSGADLATRYGIMLELMAEAGIRPQLLDLGCGPGLIVDYLHATGRLDQVSYHGIDLSHEMVEVARARWPEHAFSCRDIISEPMPEQSVDVVIMNGVLTERVTLDVETMTALAKALVMAAFRVARTGIVFNVMNAHVEWHRNDLFYWSFDSLANFLMREVSPHYVLRADYGLYEYSCIVRRQPKRFAPSAQAGWWAK